ncbi:MAG: hemolysin family protein [candidate division WOR-3 bacterium]|nr:hemolysin family protein [candidate division WOR-3 bacterium]
MFIYLIIVIILLVFSFIFSGSETAFFSFNETLRASMREKARYSVTGRNYLKYLTIIENLVNNPSTLLATILLGNLFVNTSASSVFTLFVITLAKKYDLAVDIFITIGAIFMTVLLLIFGEITPKVIAVRNPSTFALKTTNLIYCLSKLFRCVTTPLQQLGDWLLTRINRYITKTPFPSEDDLKTIIDLSKEQGLILVEEKDFLYNLVDLSHRRVSEVMTPRIQMVCLNKDLTITEVMKIITSNDFPLYSRIPVYKETVDNIVGILYLKDLTTKIKTKKFLQRPIEEIVRRPYFVPENKSLPVLLEELRKKDSHIAIVIDEYGQTAGLVTLEDILETLLGEIQDEFDTTEEMPYKSVDSRSYLVSGDIDLKTLDRLFGDFSQDISPSIGDRLSGFILHNWGRIPQKGEILIYKNYRLEIKSISRKRILKVLITKVGNE